MFEFSAFPVLTTDRLVLREWLPSDAADMFSFRSDPEAQLYNSEPMRDVSEALALIEDLRTAYASGQQIQWAVTVRPDDRAVGLFGFNYWQRFHRRAEIGYDLARGVWGRGYAYEGMAAIVRFGFEEMGLHRIETETILDNTRSIRLLERLGFQREGVRREYSLEEDGAFHASTIWGLLVHECHIF
jgi:[ribosomal protein S5]-alanine N-acetyltransferase